MLKKISNIPFSGTPEQEAALKAVITECKGGALNVASRAEADGDVVFTLGRECKLSIECGDAVDLLKGNVHSLRDHGLHLDGQIIVDLLCLLHNVHQ